MHTESLERCITLALPGHTGRALTFAAPLTRYLIQFPCGRLNESFATFIVPPPAPLQPGTIEREEQWRGKCEPYASKVGLWQLGRRWHSSS